MIRISTHFDWADTHSRKKRLKTDSRINITAKLFGPKKYGIKQIGKYFRKLEKNNGSRFGFHIFFQEKILSASCNWRLKIKHTIPDNFVISIQSSYANIIFLWSPSLPQHMPYLSTHTAKRSHWGPRGSGLQPKLLQRAVKISQMLIEKIMEVHFQFSLPIHHKTRGRLSKRIFLRSQPTPVSYPERQQSFSRGGGIGHRQAVGWSRFRRSSRTTRRIRSISSSTCEGKKRGTMSRVEGGGI